jgi:hypothetical protein
MVADGQERMSEERPRYFHGGKRGLVAGGYVLPPSITNVLSTSDYVATGGLHRRDRVYITTDLTAAQLYAAGNSGGGRKVVVYEVTPGGDVEPDPDCRHSDHSYACEKAKIVAVHNVPGKVIKKARKVFLTKGQ